MMLRPMMWARYALLGALTAGCQPDAVKPPLAPSFSTITDIATVSGHVLGPDGETNICASLPDPFESVFLLRVIDPAAGAFASDPQFIRCPSNEYAFSVAPGSYLIRATLPADPAIGALPVRSIDRLTIETDLNHDIVIRNGAALRGTATLNGVPLEGVDMTVAYVEAPGFGAGFGASGSDGTWTEFFRPPFVLQTDTRYATLGCGALGVLQLEGPPPEFLFPSEVAAVNCTLQTAASVQFSHHRTRMVVTPLPGEIGGQFYRLSNKYGIGWGVQFPVEAAASPVHVPGVATHLFQGGLMIGIAPGTILTGVDIDNRGNELTCIGPCQDLGLDGVVHYTPETNRGKQVTWDYTDAGSAEGVGLQIKQRSYDGTPPDDYVLFEFSIQNGGANTISFYAGTWIDWDVEDDASDDYGFTDMGGRLMAVASTGERGMHMGTLLLGAPVSGNFAYNPRSEALPLSPEDQFRVLSGELRSESVDAGDAIYFHSVGPVTLKKGKKASIWLAVVGGESRDQLLANARAAAADVARRDGKPVEADGVLTSTPETRGMAARAVVKRKPLR